MSLAAGTRLGPYEVLGLIGAGGMGEVYKARDTRLDRTVAIKILPAELSADPDPSADSASSRAKSRDERRARFEREAKTIAGLSHSHICTLFDVGAHDGTTYLVMEHLVGETVAERLRKGPLPLDQALTVGAEIADALAAAHRQHIIHRDLKPGNVMLTKAGAKLLDFGLAKLTGHGERPALADGATAATMTAPITERGTILGTLQYMAPEQLEGREADARTDLWALGAILCEMVTGRRAFEGDSQVSLIGNIMNAEPPGLATQQPLTPPSLERVVKKCLAKAPDDRWDTAHDVADELRWILQLNSASHPASDLRQRPSRRRVIAAFGAMIATAAGGFAVGRLVVPRTASSAIVVRFSVVADALVPQRSSESTIATSSDGRLFVFIGQFEGTRVLFLRRIDQDIVRQIAGTADATSPFLSPDGRWVAFFRDGQLLKVSLEGGPAQRIADAPSGRGGVWRSDGMIFFAPTFSGPIVQVSANGGVPQPVTVLDAKAGEDSHRFPELMPNGDVLLFTARHGAGFEDATVAAVRLATGERMTLLTGGVKGRYVPTGHLVFARATTLMAVAFDPQSLEARGSPMALLDGVDYRAIGGVSDFAVSDAGTLVYVPASAQAAELVRVQLDGSARSIGVPLAPFRAVSLSPDGRFGVVSTDRGERTDLHILDIDRGVLRPLSRGYRDETPFWCPHDARIIFSSSRKAPMALFSVSVGAAEQPHEIPSAGQWRFVTSIAPDGRTVFYGDVSPETRWDIWTQPIDGAAPGRELLGTPANERYAVLSPDGRTLVFGSDESGRMELYAVTYPALTERLQVSVSGGSEPVWAHSGRELFYRAGDALMAVKVDASPRLSAGAPSVVFRAPFVAGHELVQSYDVLPDDRGFVILRTSGGPEKARINVIQNWFEELKVKVPAGVRAK